MRISKNLSWIAIFVFVIFLACQKKENLPVGFVFLQNIDFTIVESARYFTKHNFVGKPIFGYESPHITCTKEAAEKLKKANAEFKKLGYQLVIYDGYRAQRAVNEFIDWAKDQKENKNKAYYYPRINKNEIFSKCYVAKKSGHSRGSTFDLMLIKLDKKLNPINFYFKKLKTGKEILFLDDNTLDMGSSWDLLDEASWHDSTLIEDKHIQRRNLLRRIMEKNNFKAYEKKWWHYTLKNEPFPEICFNFVIKN